jgi:hypothetical protein
MAFGGTIAAVEQKKIRARADAYPGVVAGSEPDVPLEANDADALEASRGVGAAIGGQLSTTMIPCDAAGGCDRIDARHATDSFAL